MHPSWCQPHLCPTCPIGRFYVLRPPKVTSKVAGNLERVGVAGGLAPMRPKLRVAGVAAPVYKATPAATTPTPTKTPTTMPMMAPADKPDEGTHTFAGSVGATHQKSNL